MCVCIYIYERWNNIKNHNTKCTNGWEKDYLAHLNFEFGVPYNACIPLISSEPSITLYSQFGSSAFISVVGSSPEAWSRFSVCPIS